LIGENPGGRPVARPGPRGAAASGLGIRRRGTATGNDAAAASLVHRPRIATDDKRGTLSITYTSEPDAMTSEREVELEASIGGCTTLLGMIDLCADVDVAAVSATIEAKLLHHSVFKGEISKDHPCLKIEANPSASGIGGRLDLSLCLDPGARTVFANGKVCVQAPFVHKCANLDHHVILHY
jgi:hypothetical protein